MIEITPYKADLAAVWNQFVSRSRQGTFLFDRHFMDYHADRFTDSSLMIFRKGRLWALLPANRDGDTLYTHQGLTYGGLVTTADAVAGDVCDAFVAINRYLRGQGIRRVVYKPVPHIYHRQPAEEDIFALSLRCHARLVERDASAVVALDRPMRFAESRRSGLRKARAEGLTVAESDDVDVFWSILSANLADRYNASPVHTAAEMKLLKGRFPRQIRLFLVCDARRQVLGGTVLFLLDRVVHTQYISASPEGKQKGALDLLFHHLINETNWPQQFFDFGTSARAEGNELNESLIFQKHGFGGRTVCYDWYEYEP